MNDFILKQGDCLDLMKEIPDNSIDLIVTDPPYKIVSGGMRIEKAKNDCSGIFNRRSNVNNKWNFFINCILFFVFKYIY